MKSFSGKFMVRVPPEIHRRLECMVSGPEPEEPIIKTPGLMCHGEYDDPCSNFAVDEGEGKALEKHSSGIRCGRRPSKGKGQRADCCVFD